MTSLKTRLMNHFSDEKQKERYIKTINRICQKKNLPVPERLEERTLWAVKSIHDEMVKSLTIREFLTF